MILLSWSIITIYYAPYNDNIIMNDSNNIITINAWTLRYPKAIRDIKRFKEIEGENLKKRKYLWKPILKSWAISVSLSFFLFLVVLFLFSLGPFCSLCISDCLRVFQCLDLVYNDIVNIWEVGYHSHMYSDVLYE